MMLFYTMHAQRTMAARNVSREAVEAVVARPCVTYRGNSDRDDCKVYQAGELGVVVVPVAEGLLVVTVLWRKPEKWTTDEMSDSR